MKRIPLLALLCGLLVLGPLHAATMSLSQTPLFLTNKVPPLTMLVVNRDHQLYFEAYNDLIDLDGDGIIETRFKPSIDYYGYFDSYKCYAYNASSQYFYPFSITTTKRCSGTWSGNFLNYLTTSRMDVLRKVLYGGYRSTDDSTQTILQRAYIPQDGHSWGKQYASSSVDGYNLNEYTPFAQPLIFTNDLFAVTTLRNGTGLPVLRVALNQFYKISDWISIPPPVAGSRLVNGTSGPIIPVITDYVIRVKVCDSSVGLEENCEAYPSGINKPSGLLQSFGENNSMYFGLLTGSYSSNMAGGTIRKNIASFKDEINLTTGQFTAVSGIVSTLNNLTVTGFQSNYTYDCGWITNRFMNNGECQIWGNPIGEMAYEAVRYFAGKAAPTSAYNYSGGTDASLNLPKPTWVNPYSSYPRCSPPNMIIISDIYPTYDSDQIPGSYFNSFGGDLSPALDASGIAQKIFSSEGYSSMNAFIGQAGTVGNGAPTPKTVSSFGNIRGIAPQEANSLGSYYLPSVAYYAWTTDINAVPGNQFIKSYVFELSHATKKISLTIAGVPITIFPFGKSVNGMNINPASTQFQPADALIDFYIDSLTSTSAVVRAYFSDVQQGGDYAPHAAVTYTISANSGNTFTVTTTSTYGDSAMTQHLGYGISGTTADGLYLEVRDSGTTSAKDIDYFLDTPPGQAPGGTWSDGAALPTTTTRTFTVKTPSSSVFLNSPLWYAAKWGGFTDYNANKLPDQTKEFDSTNTGKPDNYFLVQNIGSLKTQLNNALTNIIASTGTFSSAALSSGFLQEGTKVYQAIFKTTDWSGALLAFAVDPSNGDILNNGASTNGAVWDASKQILSQNYNTGRVILTFKPSRIAGIAFRWPLNPNSPTNSELDKTQSTALNTNPVTGINDNLGSDRLNFLRGNQAKETINGGTFRNRSTILGDIINSTPIIVGAPSEEYPTYWGSGAVENNVPYLDFKISNLNRKSVLYVGGNDGMLHAIDTSTGKEILAYVPSSIYANLPLLTSTNYTHRYYVDGSPTVLDAFITNQWRTMLVAGLNGGGQAIYALDVTNPNGFAENSAANIVKWEFTDANDRDLGFTFSQPAIVRLATGQWAAIFGNGYNNTYNDGNVSSSGNAVLYVVDINTGTLIKKFDTKIGMNDDPLNQGRPNGMSTPAVVDNDGTGSANVIYAGDLFGNVWKIDISSRNSNRWDFSFKSGNNPEPLFIAKDATGNTQPITTKPAIARLDTNPTGLLVIVGTGKYLETNDKTDTSIQSIYGLRDDFSNDISGRFQLQQQTIISESNGVRGISENLLANNMRGWYLDLVVNNTPKGERIISNPLFLDKKVIFSTITPTSDPCDYGGISWLMEMNAFTGSRLNYNNFDLNNNGGFDSGDAITVTQGGQTIQIPASGVQSNVGLIASPTILNAGTTQYKYLPGTSGNIQKVNENAPTERAGRQSWLQMQ